MSASGEPRIETGRTRLAAFSLLVRDFARPADEVPTARPGESCVAVLPRLSDGCASCVVIVDAAGRPVGIVTEQDVARRIALRAGSETHVEAVMTTPVQTISRREYLYCAISRMRRNQLRHMPVVDRHGRLAGILNLHEALAAMTPGMMRQIDQLSREDTVAGMREVKAAQVELAEELFAEGIGAPEIQQLLSRINNDMYRRIGEAVLRQMLAEGWGEPPVAAATIVMGSGGRCETYLFPDQDNGFILADYPDRDHGAIDAFFIELAERMCRDLNQIGIPYCNGYCMAVNPLWRKTLPQWIAQLSAWTRKGGIVAVRLADIFFDFQPVWGDPELARQLRSRVTELVRHNRSFLRQVYDDYVQHGASLGMFGGFVLERSNPDHRGQVNLKYTGVLPLVGAVRLLALREGLEETGTLARIQVLADAGVLSPRERDELSRAFATVTDVLLRRQLADFRAGKRVGYYVDPRAIGRRRRGELLGALRTINGLRKRAHLEFTAHVF
jgi:CBS domain-containing protein